MKVRNIMFSGFAAAILMGTAQAATTPFEIASKAYVDKAVNDLSANGGALKEVSDAVDALEEDVGDMSTLDGDAFGQNTDSVVEALNDLDDAINTKQDKLGGTGNIGVVTSTADAGVVTYTTVDSTVNNNANLVTGAAVQSYVSGAIADVTGGATVGTLPTNPTTEQPYTTVGAALADMNTAIGLKQNEADSNVASNGNYIQSGHGVAANLGLLDTNLKRVDTAVGDSTSGLVADVAALQQTIGDGTTSGVAADVADLKDTVGDSTDGLVKDVADLQGTVGDSTDGLVKDVADLQGTMGTGTLNGFSNGVDTVIEALNDLQSNKLNKPIPNTCTAQSQHCVLHMDNTGALSWVDITVPYTEESGGNNGGSEPSSGNEEP